MVVVSLKSGKVIFFILLRFLLLLDGIGGPLGWRMELGRGRGREPVSLIYILLIFAGGRTVLRGLIFLLSSVNGQKMADQFCCFFLRVLNSSVEGI